VRANFCLCAPAGCSALTAMFPRSSLVAAMLARGDKLARINFSISS
jgi:hypothetical protein